MMPAEDFPSTSSTAVTAAGTGQSSMSTVDMAARLVDLKGLSRPPTFDGSFKSWADWKFAFENVGTLMGIENGMNEVVMCREEELERFEEQHAAVSKVLYGCLLYTSPSPRD